MDILKINHVVDKFMRNLYDVDMWFKKSNWSDAYCTTFLLFPDKFLKKGKDFSQKYYDFFNQNPKEIQDDIQKPIRYLSLGIVPDMDCTYFKVSDVWGEYLSSYVKNLKEVIDGFLSEKILDYNSNPGVTYQIYFMVVNWDWTMYEVMGEDVSNERPIMVVFEVPKLLYSSTRDELNEHLKETVEVDPQIKVWIE